MARTKLDASDRELRNESLLAILEVAVGQGDEPARPGDPSATRALFGVILSGGGLFILGLILWGAWGAEWVLLSLAALFLIGISWSLHRAVESVSPAPLWTPDPKQEHLDLSITARSTLRPWAEDGVWVAEQPLRSSAGLSVGSRMAVMTANDAGDLLIYNPIALPAPLRRAIQEKGQVRWVVSPNGNHHRFMDEWAAAFPNAELWAAPRLASRRPDLDWTGVIGRQHATIPWDEQHVSATLLEGLLAPEVVLYHTASATLLVADAIVNMGHHEDTGLGLTAGLELLGMRKRPGPPVTMKWTVTQREPLQDSVRDVLRWPFQRIFLAHGRLIDHDAQRVWKDAFSFLIDED